MAKKGFYTSKYFHLIICAALAIAAALILLPFGTSEKQSGHDLKYHLGVIRALSAAWEKGDFFGKLVELVGGDYGYGTGLFYSTLPAGLCVLLMQVFSLPVMWALYVELFLLFCSASIIVYFFLRRVFNSNALGAIGATVYLCHPYFWWDLYVRFAFSEIFLMLAMPLIVWGVYELLYRNNPRAFLPLFIVGYTLSIYAHLTMTVYITLLIAVWLLIDCRRVFKGKNVLYFAIGAAVVGFLTASYYLPMLVNYGVTATDGMSKTPAQMEVNTKKYFTEEILMWDYKFAVGLSVIYALWYVFLARRKRTAGRTALFVCSLLVPVLFTHYFPWQYMPNFLRMIQYTFRVLLLGCMLAPLQVCVLIQQIFGSLLERRKRLRGAPNAAPESAEIIRRQKNFVWKNLVKFIPLVLLCAGFAYCGTVGVSHNRAMLSAYDQAATSANVALDELTGRSEFYALGAGKHGDYFPKNCKWAYVSTRLVGEIVSNTNLKVSELADYRALEQVSFVVPKTENGYVVLNVPYEMFDGVEIFRFRTTSSNRRIGITAEQYDGGAKTLLTVANDGNESKVILSYKNAPLFKAYLSEKAFGVLALSGDVTATNLQKERAGKYSVDVTAGADGGVLELPSYYYKGYRLTLVTGDGRRVSITPIHGRNGFLEVEITESGRLYVEFSAPYLTAANALTAVGVALFGGVVVWCVLCKTKKEIKTEKE